MPLRYLVDFNTEDLKKEIYDVIILGSGVAGLYAAINLDSTLSVCVISKETLEDNNSSLAQGGIAVALGDDDMPAYHYEDTIKAGAGHCNEEAVHILVEEAPRDIKMLCSIGTNFDRNPDGTLTATREGGHGRFRIVHALGDGTGKEVVQSLLRECKKRSNIKIIENCFGIDFLTHENKCMGVLILSNDEYSVLYSKNTIIASGGIGQVYKNTTNLEVATGDGIAMAYRAGAKLCDMEFVQFHPTALYDESKNDRGNRFLVSEAVRGEGGILRNKHGETFMHKYDPAGEIAPRDIVSRSIFAEMKATNSTHVYLDVTHKDGEYMKKRFPNIYEHCLKIGVDFTKDYIPVCPTQHYFMGGIKTDIWGSTNIENLYACGEAANSGVHGANRLASNSLLEGLVFGNRSAKKINTDIKATPLLSLSVENQNKDKNFVLNVSDIQKDIKEEMEAHAGIVRNEADMQHALEKVENYIAFLETYKFSTVKDMETINMVYIAYEILKAAIERKNNMGSHYRSDSLFS